MYPLNDNVLYSTFFTQVPEPQMPSTRRDANRDRIGTLIMPLTGQSFTI
jgi:hypothetical protein